MLTFCKKILLEKNIIGIELKTDEQKLTKYNLNNQFNTLFTIPIKQYGNVSTARLKM
jgi:hypothetical protein